MPLPMPVIEGVIRRRILVNYRIDPELLRRLLPAPLEPDVQTGYGVAGICLIRLEHIRPLGLPAVIGFSSENAAHRVAVRRPDGVTGVFVPRRDTNSLANFAAGGRLFPGEQHLADFKVSDCETTIDLDMRARDGGAQVHVQCTPTDDLPATSCFGTLEAASDFFKRGCLGWSSTSDAHRLDGMRLETEHWVVSPVAVSNVASSFFDDRSRFPAGTVEFDCALLMRNIPHRWVPEPSLAVS